MIVYHVTTLKKLMKYLQNGGIKPPVRGWLNINYAERFSKQTGRRIILRLKFPDNLENVEKVIGHKGMAVFYTKWYNLEGY